MSTSEGVIHLGQFLKHVWQLVKELNMVCIACAIQYCSVLYCTLPSAYVASSGLAATSLIIQTLKSGDHILTMDDLYGGVCVCSVCTCVHYVYVFLFNLH